MCVGVCGAGGFIGVHVAKALLDRGDTVLGIDNRNAYYDQSLKTARLSMLESFDQYTDLRADIADAEALSGAFASFKPDGVINLAAQAGVRHSIDHPQDYVNSNLVGFANIREASRQSKVSHLVYAATSSVYGANRSMPFRETDGVGHPMSFYAATKRANEVMAHSYSHIHGLPTTGLRFFTVYGPWGRPDMALFKFCRAILNGEPIDVYNNGDMRRDFTYVDDIVEGVVRTLDTPPSPDPDWDATLQVPDADRSGVAPFRLFNIGRGEPVQLLDFIKVIEQKLQKPAMLNMLPMQAGDVSDTYADTSALEKAVGYRPSVSVEDGVSDFVDWYRRYYGV